MSFYQTMPTVREVVDPQTIYDRSAAIRSRMDQLVSGNETSSANQIQRNRDARQKREQDAYQAAILAAQRAAAKASNDAATSINNYDPTAAGGATGAYTGGPVSFASTTAGGSTAIWGDPRSKGWQARNLTSFRQGRFSVTVNKQAASAFKGFLTELSGKGYKLNDVSGYNLRGKRSNPSSLSEHAFGTAIDINPESNPANFHGKLITNMPSWVGSLARKYGLLWGGYWKHMPDPMHFEYKYQGGAVHSNGSAPGHSSSHPTGKNRKSKT